MDHPDPDPNARPRGEGDGQHEDPIAVVGRRSIMVHPIIVISPPTQSMVTNTSSRALDVDVSQDMSPSDCYFVSFSWNKIDVWAKVKEEKKRGDVIDISNENKIFHAESIPIINFDMAQPNNEVQAEGLSHTTANGQPAAPNPIDGEPLNDSAAAADLKESQRQLEDVLTPANKIRTIVGMKRMITKHILKKVSGYVKQGELVALMGASGAGKTTLLNVLTCRSSSKVEVSGEVCVNGTKTGVKEINSISAYIQQGDLFPGALTVLEHLTFCAFMRMGNSFTKKERAKRINHVIEEFGLLKCLHTKIGIPGRIKGISGGEKRRLAVASELLWNPDLLFCDEPLSGLDSCTAEELMNVMKRLTTKYRKTIICTVHQPSSYIYHMFDRIILLAEGHTAFNGSRQGATDFFTELGYPTPMMSNPSDHFIEIIMITPDELNDGSRAKVKRICDAFEKSAFQNDIKELLGGPPTHGVYEARLNTAKSLSKYRVGWWSQFASLLYRDGLIVINDRVLLFNKLILAIAMSLMIGLTLFNVEVTKEIADASIPNIGSIIFLMMVNVSIQNIFGVLNTFHEELPLLLREHDNHMYRTSPYFLAKQLTDIPVLVIFPSLFYVTTYALVTLTWNESDFVLTGGVLLILAQSAAGFGYFISCTTKTIEMALSVGPGLLMPLALFSGFFIPKSTMDGWTQVLAHASWFHWGNEAIMPIQFKGIARVTGTGCVNNVCPTGRQVLEKRFEFYEDNFWLDLVMLSAIALGLRILAFFAILWRTKE